MAQVITEGTGRQSEDVVLQLLQIMYTCHFLHRIGIAENKIAKSEMLGQHVLHVLIQFLGVLIDKSSMALVGIGFLVGLAGIENQGHIFVHLTDGTQ